MSSGPIGTDPPATEPPAIAPAAPSAPAASSTASENAHLFLLIHGLWGNPAHMSVIEKTIKHSLSPVSREKIVFLKPASFRFWKTYDGIQRCAENVVADLLYEIETLKQDRRKVVKISVVGYSLGGLIGRYVVGQLHDMGFFDEVAPVHFCTFATPHAGVHFFKNTVFDRVANVLGMALFGKTGFQLFVADSPQLLVQMSRPGSRYYEGLQAFQQRILVANIKNDRSVAFWTSYITRYSPFESLNYVNVRYLENLPSAKVGRFTVWPKFVDLAKSQKVASPEEHSGNVQEATSFVRSNRWVRTAVLACAAILLVPVYIPLIICLSLYVSCYSIVKVRICGGPEIHQHWASVKEAVYHGGKIDEEHAKQGRTRRLQRMASARQDSFKGDTSHFTEHAMENVLYAEDRLGNGRNVIEEQPLSFEGGPKDHFFIDKASESEAEEEDAAEDAELLSERCAFSSEGSDSETAAEAGPEVGASSKLGAPSKLGASSEVMASSEVGAPAGATAPRRASLLTTFLKKDRTVDIDLEGNDAVILENRQLLNSADSFPLFEEEAALPLTADFTEIVDNLNTLQWIKIPVFHDSFNAHDSVVARRGMFSNPKGTCTLFLWGSILRVHQKDKASGK